MWANQAKGDTWIAYNGESQITYGSEGISFSEKLGPGQYRFYFDEPKWNYILSGSSTTNAQGFNTWICYVSKAPTYVEVSTCDTLPYLEYVDTANLDVLISEF
ncbi:hypothetical protein PuT2_15690 [Pusillimonas sp. T2]|nr:hypothetical protein PuT2_15690 [Pusillimonas sp. T2]